MQRSQRAVTNPNSDPKNRHHAHYWRGLRRVLAAVLTSLLFAHCSEPPDSLTRIRDEGVLRVVTRNGATTYYENQGQPTGFEYHLAKAFAKHLGVELEMVTMVGLDDIFTALENNRADFAAAGLSVTEGRKARLAFGPTYMTVEQFIIYNRDQTPGLSTVKALVDKRIRVIADSSHVEILEQLQQIHPQLSWTESRDLEAIDLLEQLRNGDIDATIVHSNVFHANRAFYPTIRIALNAGEDSPLAWALRPGEDNAALLEEMSVFFTEIKASGRLARLVDRFFTLSEQQTFISNHTFMKMKSERLPQYKGLIEQVAIEYDMDWRLLAAMSYQESHWNPKAKSPTGVLGMMMLTGITAKELGVTNRLDALQSLRGGARYYKKLLARLPSSIEQPDRNWFALAAYNIGLGHLEDARILTETQGGNPNLWRDVKKHLPLLRQRKWYETTKYGYARGDEPVRYVRNIRNYYSILTFDELNRYRVPPPKIVSDYLPAEINRSLNGL